MGATGSEWAPKGRLSVGMLLATIIGGAMMTEVLNLVVLVLTLEFFGRFTTLLDGAAKVDAVRWSLTIIGFRTLMSIVSNLVISGPRLRMYVRTGTLPATKPLTGRGGAAISDAINLLQSVVASTLALSLAGGSANQILVVTCTSSLVLMLFGHFAIERPSRKREASHIALGDE